MNPLDIVIIIILGFCLIRGVFRGLVKELSAIIGVFGGFYAAYTYYPVTTDYLSPLISNIAYMNILGFLIIFCSVFIAISLLGILIKRILSIASMGWIDSICGGGFGIIKGLLIVSVILFALTTFLPKNASIVKDSLLSPHVSMVSEKLAKVVPKEMRDQFIDKIDELKKAWKQLS